MSEAKRPDLLRGLLSRSADPNALDWLESRLQEILDPPSARNLFLTYSLIGRTFPDREVQGIDAETSEIQAYMGRHAIREGELARVYLLARALVSDPEYFTPKVRQLAQVADTGELVTFLRYLSILPGCEAFADTAVDALRTNIADVFKAIALDNPYPAAHFNTQQWNQMYLKAAFMQLDLLAIPGVEARANPDLVRIISDYAHERWAASREIDPAFWRPVSPFLEGGLLEDMQRLLSSANPAEQQAGYLCCLASGKPEARDLISGHTMDKVYSDSPFGWEDINA